MEPEEGEFSFKKRAAEKAAARECDEEMIRSGEVSAAEMARRNGGSLRSVRYKGPSERIRAIAKSFQDKEL